MKKAVYLHVMSDMRVLCAFCIVKSYCSTQIIQNAQYKIYKMRTILNKYKQLMYHDLCKKNRGENFGY